ncbi:MAG: hypothetical protein KAT01_09230 [Candidatus Aminicenantes bacterium]|nr:hypothetical protein [Candidatus Aminicenantes bacterium]
MSKKILFLSVSIAFFSLLSVAQFTKGEIAEFKKWEKFLTNAEIVSSRPWEETPAVTDPWVLTLEKDGITKQAMWKNPEGRQKGSLEGWKWEIAAYRLSNHLGLYMVSPTVEKRFRGDRGSCQLFVDAWMDLETKESKKIKVPSYKVFHWNRALYSQRTFDNLIANEDRHQRNFFIMEDWRLILIDHSRSFRTSKKFTKDLIYDEDFREGPRLMKEIPQTLYEKMKSLTPQVIRDVVEDYLTDKEIECVLLRRDLIIDWLDKRIKELGEDKVLY